jgi:predicted nucleic acid-binding protein
MIYLDTSCLLKLLIEEPESPAVRRAVAAEADVIVSTLTELEASTRLRAGWLAGHFPQARYRAYLRQLTAFRTIDPFQFRSLPGSLFETARRQDRQAGRVHCRTLDRLHLAAMEELGVPRLMTNDDAEASGARALGFEVLRPGRVPP